MTNTTTEEGYVSLMTDDALGALIIPHCLVITWWCSVT